MSTIMERAIQENRLFEYFKKDMRHQETTEHTLRCVDLASRFGQYIGISERELAQLENGMLIHDLGKYYISPELLYANRRLTEDEFKIVRNHPKQPLISLNKLIEHEDAVSIRIMLEHHERLDGTGYPNQLKSDQIHFLSKLASIVDVYDALSNIRSYKHAWTDEEIIHELQKGAGTFYDEKLVNQFIDFIFEYKG